MKLGSADLDFCVAQESIGRHRKIGWCRSLPDAARRVEHGAVARALPALERAFIAERHATEMGAAAVNDEPLILAFLDAGRVRLRIGQGGYINVSRRFDFGGCAMPDEDKFTAPEELDDLTFGDGGEIDFHRCTCRHCRRIRRHLADKGPKCARNADSSRRARCDEKEIPSCVFGVTRCAA